MQPYGKLLRQRTYGREFIRIKCLQQIDSIIAWTKSIIDFRNVRSVCQERWKLICCI